MLTKLTIRNFKRFDEVEIELGHPVVFIGPNDSGKTTALQAIALWELGLRRWHEKLAPERSRPLAASPLGVTINRRDLFAVPVPDANLLWRDLRLKQKQGKEVRVEIIIEGVTDGKSWCCGLKFNYANEESFYCQPLQLQNDEEAARMPIPSEALEVRAAFLPPMSGLTDREFVKQAGEINFLIGQGRTAEVLRNLCYQLVMRSDGSELWRGLSERIKTLFGVELSEPRYIPERSEIEMSYRTQSGISLDLSSSGRGLQQTLLLLVYLAAHANSVILLDEPDAHLEILRQRQIYQVLTEMAREQSSQIIAASHSEVVLNQAARRDMVIAFVGKPHRIDNRGSQVLKSLRDIGFEQYYQAEQTGWVLYLEGSTDLSILQAFADTLKHPASNALARPFVYYISSDQPQKAREHFYGLREAKPDLVGFALFDRMNRRLFDAGHLQQYMWQKREIENYLCQRETLLAWLNDTMPKGEVVQKEADTLAAPLGWPPIFEQTITEIESALKILGKGSPWSADIKASDDVLDPLFAAFYKKLHLPNLFRKTDYHTLARFVPKDKIDQEINQVLGMILAVSQKARGNESAVMPDA